ncbi:transmembrane protein -like [Brachionus plicatilis]|uniref:Transmembrane protein-like n=1 Tax=Brachionus plicatilis TaxID=10195 RepID=A0A3M7R307_BRAPC|nr:transmembrane protein -like [Brachionus plicatilis]RNA17990.1 transmembrane protein -like [Brachionus plicatilis]
MENFNQDWKAFENDLDQFQAKHKEYVRKLEEVESMKKKYSQEFNKLKKKLTDIQKNAKKLDFNNDQKKSEIGEPTSPNKESSGDLNLNLINEKINENFHYIRHVSDTFPRPNGLYLKIILGGISVSILNNEEKLNYKEEYEKFKLRITMICLILSFLLIFIRSYRTLDAAFNFLLVWYYCTLTIRESILVVNGSEIKGWWQAHHFITTVCTAILLIWPDSESYQLFRQQFIWFSFYLSIVQVLQYYYQKGCLYRLRALGEKQDMDTTIEGFQSWMTKGLSFLLPFLFFGYFWELYNSYVLFTISQMDNCHEWQVMALCIIFLILFLGNFVTTFVVVRRKYSNRISDKIRRIKSTSGALKYLRSFSDKQEEKTL